MLINIQGDWIDPKVIWRISFDESEKTACVFMSPGGDHVQSVITDVDREFVDDLAAKVNAAVEVKA